MARVYLAMPHAGQLLPGALCASSEASKGPIMTRASGNSTLTHNFNSLWCDALNERKANGITHFAMCHYDINPEPWWVDKLLAEMDRVDADILSVVVPIKDARGLTSTGLGPIGRGGVKRLTIREIHQLPVTFSIEAFPIKGFYLAVNTGLWLARIDGIWPDSFPGFRVQNEIRRDSETGQFFAVFRPEDWLMSDWAHQQGLRVFATRAVSAGHFGWTEYRNDFAWGEWDEDQEHRNGVINGDHGLACAGYNPKYR